ncbi:MAG: hypothetical protein M3Z33_07310, partial [Actinomycetota bacterium]|nr:hypothetical protein [Actinomycetota bacterium]
AAIGGAVGSISGLVGSIGNRVATIRAAVGSRNSSGNSISANVIKRIQPTFLALDPVVRSIDTEGPTHGVKGINQRGDQLISSALVAGIKSDFDQIIAGVTKINTHANSINCAPLFFVQGLGPTPPGLLTPATALRNQTPGCIPP